MRWEWIPAYPGTVCRTIPTPHTSLVRHLPSGHDLRIERREIQTSMDRSKYMRAPDAQLNLVWWLEQVSAAPDTAAVMSIVTQFIAAWPPQKIAEMPHGCRPGRLATPDDVGTYATSLARAEL